MKLGKEMFFIGFLVVTFAAVACNTDGDSSPQGEDSETSIGLDPTCPPLLTYPAPLREIHVALDGNDDTGDGTADNPYRTIETGIRQVSGPGDHEIVGPGTYQPQGSFCGFSSIDEVMAEAPGIAGTAENPIVLRAETPGTVLWSLHTILPAQWTQVSGDVWSFDYSAYLAGFPCHEPSQLGQDIDFTAGVAGIRFRNGGDGPDTGLLLFPVESQAEVGGPGEWYRDTGSNTIYARTTDGQSPNQHQMSFSFGLQALRVDRMSHWIIEGIHFHGGHNNIQFRHDQGPTDYLTIQNCTFSSAGDHRIGGDSTNGSHIRIDQRRGRGWQVLHNRIYSSTSEMIHSGDTSNYVADGTSAAPGDLYACNVFDGSGHGQYFSRADNPTGRQPPDSEEEQPCLIIATELGDVFLQNDIKYCSYGAILEWNARGTQWLRNDIHDHYRGAINFSPHGASYNGEHLIANNFVWSIFSGGGGVGIFSLRGTTYDSTLINNTIAITDGIGGSSIFYVTSSSYGSPDNLYFAGNIAFNSSATNQTLVWIDSGTNLVFEDNLYYRENQTHPRLFYLDGVEYDDLASWQAAGMDAGSMISDPLLIDEFTGDLHITAQSPAIDAGQDFSTLITTDYDGDDRPTGAWDIGADEL